MVEINIEDYKQEDVGLVSARNLGLEETMEVRELREIRQLMERNGELEEEVLAGGTEQVAVIRAPIEEEKKLG